MIRQEKSPMSAKMVSKKYKHLLNTNIDNDINRMTLCLDTKVNQHPELIQMLLDTGGSTIIEDCSNRHHGSGMYWGSAFIDGKWVGKNVLGNLWMDLRNKISNSELSNN